MTGVQTCALPIYRLEGSWRKALGTGLLFAAIGILVAGVLSATGGSTQRTPAGYGGFGWNRFSWSRNRRAREGDPVENGLTGFGVALIVVPQLLVVGIIAIAPALKAT